jgi:pimeloyl-ACP methyl ester carboxylesterase
MADPVVFIPGLAHTGELFSDQIAAVSVDRTVTIANHRRHDTISALAETLLAETAPRFVLAALSMGGYVAFEILRRAPERVSALVLMNTTARPDSDETRERRERLIAIVEAGRFAEVPAMQMQMQVAPERTNDADILAIVRRMAEQTGPEAFMRQQRAILARPDSRPTLATISCPTLMIMGDRDQIVPIEHGQEIVAGIAGSRMVTMPMCGHLSTLERPQAATHALMEFLAGLPASE